MKRLTLNEAKDLVRELVKSKEFPESEAVLYQKLLWAFVELGEASDAFKKGENWEVVAEELVDTIFYVVDFIGLVEKTQGVRLDLDEIFLKKWEKNMKRPNHYGLRKDVAYSEGVIPRPLKKLTIEITKKCFNRCVHCSAYVPGENAEEIMTLENARMVVDQFVRLGGEELNISGGEPLLHPDWAKIARYAKGKGLAVNLFTCGVLSEKTIAQDELLGIIAQISEARFDGIETTLHAPNAAMHDDITKREGSFRSTVGFTRLLSSVGSSLCVNFVPMQINSDELEEVVDYVSSIGVPKLNILRFIPQGRGQANKDWLLLPRDQCGRLVKVALKLSKRKDIDVSLSHPGDFIFLLDKTRKPKPCTAGKDQCKVKISGDVVPCPAFGDLAEWVAENAFNNTLESIWNTSPVFVRLREFDHRRLQGDCRIREYAELCEGRCPAQRIRENGDLYRGPDPSCPKDFV